MLNRDHPIISRKELNRTSLNRQLLLRRSDLSAAEAVSHLIAFQSQAHKSVYVGLWCRLKNVSIEACDKLLINKTLVRSTLMRGTLHVSTADDSLSLSPLFSNLMERSLWSNFGSQLNELDVDAVATHAKKRLEQESCTYAELGKYLANRWPDHDPSALAQVARYNLSLVQAPPLLWGSSQRPRVMTKYAWLKRDASGSTPIVDTLRRYIAAYGPATVQDMQKWLGLSGLAPIIREIADQLSIFRSAEGDLLYDLPDCERIEADVESPARLLPGFDATVLAYHNPSRFVDDHLVKKLSTRNGLFHPVFLIDGRIAGSWTMKSEKHRLSVALNPFVKLTDNTREELVEEAEALAQFTRHQVLEISIAAT